MHHPWRAFSVLTHIKLRWADLPLGLLGYTDHLRGEVVLAKGLTQTQRRCVIEHERHHVLRGPVPPHLREREERAVEREAARLLLPDISVVADALVWAQNLEEAADELWVDVAMLRCRLASLHPSERGYLSRRLDES